MDPIEIFYLVAALVAFGTVGVWMTLRSSWNRIEANDRTVNKRIDDTSKAHDEKMNQHCQQLHDRISKHADQMQGLQIHIAERYVRHDQLDKALMNVENSVLKEVHAVKDQVELMNKHLAQLIKMVGRRSEEREDT